jgi:predicted DNA-binding transcriptional regulator AlpA
MTIKTVQARSLAASEPTARPTRRGKAVALKSGTAVIWPAGIQARYGISAPTRWRWEKTGRLPPRDVSIGGRTGWRPETIVKAETATSAAHAA